MFAVDRQQQQQQLTQATEVGGKAVEGDTSHRRKRWASKKASKAWRSTLASVREGVPRWPAPRSRRGGQMTQVPEAEARLADPICWAKHSIIECPMVLRDSVVKSTVALAKGPGSFHSQYLRGGSHCL